MNTARTIRLLAAALLLGVGVVLAACGGGGGQSAEEYFRDLQALSDRVNQEFDVNEEDLSTVFDVEDPTQVSQGLVDLLKEVFDKNVETLRDALDTLDGLEPPDDVEESHDAFRDAVAELRSALDELGDKVSALEEPVDLEAFFAENEEVFQSVDERFQKACVALEKAAGEHDFDLDLDCQGAEE